uniref:Uncharacterized protein n=1 Tax=Soybean thrips denso-like virus 2 TaxID=2803989 RepID=A0A7T8E853_9VIRU|nr:putative protein 3 [Soybean thrips denso-like virus 2]
MPEPLFCIHSCGFSMSHVPDEDAVLKGFPKGADAPTGLEGAVVDQVDVVPECAAWAVVVAGVVHGFSAVGVAVVVVLVSHGVAGWGWNGRLVGERERACSARPSSRFDEGVGVVRASSRVGSVQDESIAVSMVGMAQSGYPRIKLLHQLQKSRASLWDQNVVKDVPFRWDNTAKKTGHHIRVSVIVVFCHGVRTRMSPRSRLIVWFFVVSIRFDARNDSNSTWACKRLSFSRTVFTSRPPAEEPTAELVGSLLLFFVGELFPRPDDGVCDSPSFSPSVNESDKTSTVSRVIFFLTLLGVCISISSRRFVNTATTSLSILDFSNQVDSLVVASVASGRQFFCLKYAGTSAITPLSNSSLVRNIF